MVRMGCVAVAVLSLAAWQASAKPLATEEAQRRHNYSRAWDAAQAARKSLRDFNGDGKVTCIDWAFAYIHEWRRMYPWMKNGVKAAVNQGGRMNHMFVMIRVYDPATKRTVWWAIEPSARHESQLDMGTYWKGKYDPSRDRTGEPAEKWLRRCRW